MILDIVRPTVGSISVLGAPSALDVRERIGYLPEEKGLYKKMRAWAVIAYFATLKGISKPDAKKRAYALLERYGLSDFADAKIEALSKGMGQKVQVLASIAHDPELVILDEPFSGLDPSNQQVMEDVIHDFAKQGRTVLFSTHVMSHAERICDRLLLIAKGEKAFDGTVSEARDVIPLRVSLTTESDPTPLTNLDCVVSLEPDGAAPHAFVVTMARGASPSTLLQFCFEQNIVLQNFSYAETTLHDVFLHLVGADAKEATLR
jgi:ABC-2 type transport system ATP-binding protein